MDNWEKFNETSLPYTHLYMEDATDSDYASAKRVSKDFEIKHLGDYHYFYVESNALLLADVFENFRNICLKRYELDPSKILAAPGLAWQASAKKTKIKLDLLTDVNMLLMYHSIYQHAKTNNKNFKNYNKNKDLSYI